jgi:arginase family enzyme
VIPFTAPPVWPEVRPGRFAASIVANSTEILDSPDADRLLAKCPVALLGMPDDTGVELNHGRMGARQGPHAVRAALAKYGVAHPMDHAGPSAPYPRVFDAGDVIVGRDLDETHERVSSAAQALVERGMLPIGIGGGHDLTFAFVRGVARAAPYRGSTLGGVYFDAHLDVRAEKGSGMPFRALVEQARVHELRAIGISPLVNSREHFEWFTEHRGTVDGDPFTPPPQHSWPVAGPQFVSFDMDVLDAAYAPGVSALNPAGMTPGVAAAWCFAAGANPDVVCFDLMEFNPQFDPDGRTARVAAHLLLSFLRGFTRRTGAGR